MVTIDGDVDTLGQGTPCMYMYDSLVQLPASTRVGVNVVAAARHMYVLVPPFSWRTSEVCVSD